MKHLQRLVRSSSENSRKPSRFKPSFARQNWKPKTEPRSLHEVDATHAEAAIIRQTAHV